VFACVGTQANITKEEPRTINIRRKSPNDKNLSLSVTIKYPGFPYKL
jgi:hypothetical protein